ncbi:metabotropic GABA-B receptor subtype 2 [Loa loa]|uniref:Gamma-aminobutyric acid type B receptor subunit 2 n=1 Tax=Loa loa TaxID=7209 RepID=A0A1S0TVQ6_LOALO|nr:metabotropic GABA-B receptor subtype 2 [Loa loa]EFO20901.1 metabotropic GABA-B receptor subtype 2 [Loa loa]
MAQIWFGYTHDCQKLRRINRIPLTIGVFLPYQYKRVLELAVNTALEHIHNQSCILNDYYLNLHFKDTECKTSFGMKALFELMNAHPRPFALFGDACTNVNEVVAMASKYWHILHLSYAEIHAKFATADAQAMYPTFFRMVPGYQNSNLARCHLIYQFNWTRVGTLKQSDDPRFALPHESLTTRLEHGFGVRVIYTAGITHDEIQNIGYELNELKKRDARIFIGDFEESLAVRILCEAYQNGIYGENYAWILPGYHKNDWWHNVSGVNCTVEELAQVIEGHFAVEFSPYSQRLARLTIANKTVSAIRTELDAREGSSPESVFKGYVYDGLWTLALAIEHVAELHQQREGITWMPNVSDTKEWTKFSAELLQAISRTSFIGVTGPVQFENNERLGLVEILQWRNGSYLIAGIYDGTEAVLVLNPALKDWIPPLDATIVVRERQYISFVLLILLSLLATIGVAVAVFFLIINIRYQNHRYIKMSSPNMNNLIIAGSICTYISVILLGFDTRFVSPDTFVTLCYVKTWVLSLGFTLAFGSMFSKTWRVHLIFKNIRMNKKAIKDYKLFILVGFIVLVDLISLTLWARISPFTFHVNQLAIFYSDNKMIAPEIEHCQSDNSVIFEAIILGIKGLLMLLGCFLAWETRRVNVPALNDSKYIGMSVYSVVVTCLLGLPLVYILKDRINEAHILGSLFIIFCTTLILCLVFVPKFTTIFTFPIVELFRNPQGTELRYRRGLVKSSLRRSESQRDSQYKDREHLQRLEEENILLHRYLLQKTSILWELKEQLRQLGEQEDDIVTPPSDKS